MGSDRVRVEFVTSSSYFVSPGLRWNTWTTFSSSGRIDGFRVDFHDGLWLFLMSVQVCPCRSGGTHCGLGGLHDVPGGNGGGRQRTPLGFFFLLGNQGDDPQYEA